MCTIVFAISKLGMSNSTPCTQTTPELWATKRAAFTTRQNSNLSQADKQQLLTEINNYIDNSCVQGGIINTNKTLSTTISQLEKHNDELKVDVESALARDELLRSRETATNPHQLFLLDRPIRRNMIPYLWIMSILFIGAALAIFKIMAPTMASPESLKFLVLSFFTNVYVLYALLGAAAITILFLSLKVANVI
jgi:hypothetical protein